MITGEDISNTFSDLSAQITFAINVGVLSEIAFPVVDSAGR